MPINRKIAVAFNQAMDPLTINTTTFTVTGPGLTPVTGTVTYDATNHIAIFAPTGLLPASTTFTGTITTGATSAGSRALRAVSAPATGSPRRIQQVQGCRPGDQH